MNMIQPLLNSFSPQALGALAGNLNETPERTRQGLADALPVFFASLIAKASTIAGATGLLNMLRSTPFDLERLMSGRDAPTNTPNVLREGESIAHSVLGENYGQAANAIARHSGVGIESAQSLLGMAAPLALGGIAKAAPAGGFTAEGLMRFLQGQRDDVMAMAPAGLPLNIFDRPAGAAQRAASTPAPSRGNRMLPWIIGAGAAVLLALMLGQCMNQRQVTPPAAIEPPQVVAPEVQTTPPNMIELPGGVRLDLPVGSIGHSLATYLADPAPAPRTFTFDNLNFDSGNVALTPESTATIDAIAATLRAYPNVAIRLDGHTDSTGDRQSNVDLSLARANSVARLLTERGIDASRVTTAGFGPDRPLATNETEEGRAQNRRLELTVTRK